jgi:hypothetical protein
MEEYTNYIINRLLKPRNIKVLKAEGYTFTMPIKDINALTDHVNSLRGTKDTFSPSNSVLINHHTLDRWNERVGPIVSLDSLQKSLEIIFKNCPYRISKLDQGIASIDNDIIFTYDSDESEFSISTFYGRKTLQPTLNHVKTLRKYNLHNNEYVNLTLSNEELNEQILPFIPKEIIYFEGHLTSYILEKYIVSDRILPCFHCYKKEFKKSGFLSILIDLEKPEQEQIPNNVLYMLYRLGYGEFVIDYFKIHKPEKLIKARNKVMQYFSPTSQNDFFLN